MAGFMKFVCLNVELKKDHKGEGGQRRGCSLKRPKQEGGGGEVWIKKTKRGERY